MPCYVEMVSWLPSSLCTPSSSPVLHYLQFAAAGSSNYSMPCTDYAYDVAAIRQIGWAESRRGNGEWA